MGGDKIHITISEYTPAYDVPGRGVNDADVTNFDFTFTLTTRVPWYMRVNAYIATQGAFLSS